MIRSHRRARAALTGVALLLFSFTACTADRTPEAPEVPGGPRPSPTAPSPRISSKLKAIAEAERLVGLVRVPAGSTTASSAPVPGLERPPQVPSSPYLVSVHRWWSSPLPASTVLASIGAHPPEGLHLVGSGSGGSGGEASTPYLIFQGRPTRDYNSVTLLVTGASDGQGSAIRADGQVLWVPARTTAEDVPQGVRAVGLLAYRNSPTNAIARTDLSGGEATRVARLVNGLPRDNRGPHGCTMDTGLRIRITFATGDGPLVFVVWPACATVLVSADGQAQPGLLDQGPLNQVLMRDLGIDSAG